MSEETVLIHLRDRTHDRLKTITGVIGILICILMLLCAWVRGNAQTGGEKLAVLQSRTDAIDNHLSNTDHNVTRLYDKLDELESRFSTMQGEEYAAWGVLTLLGMGNLITLRKRG